MRQPLFSELWYKMTKSGSRLNLFVGINAIVFIAIGLIAVIDFITGTNIAAWLTTQLSMPAWLPSLGARFWSPLTYMFLHRDFFHILFNLLWLYWIGRIFEEYLNGRQFTFVYIAGGLAGAVFYMAAFNFIPVFGPALLKSNMLGASAGVSAIVIATATLLPDYTIMLLLFGEVRLKYLALVFIIFNLLSITSINPGGSIAHLGGALLGYIFIKQLQSGNDWSKVFQKRSKLKIVRNDKTPVVSNKIPDQEVIDRILDKISKSGYESLNNKEKEQLFNASKK